MIIGFITNFLIGCFAYFLSGGFTNLRKVDAATVAGYYGSDFGRHVCHVRGRVHGEQYRVCRLHAGDAGRDGSARLPGGTVSRLASTRQGHGLARNSPDEPGYNPDSIGTSELGHDHHVGTRRWPRAWRQSAHRVDMVEPRLRRESHGHDEDRGCG